MPTYTLCPPGTRGKPNRRNTTWVTRLSHRGQRAEIDTRQKTEIAAGRVAKELLTGWVADVDAALAADGSATRTPRTFAEATARYLAAGERSKITRRFARILCRHIGDRRLKDIKPADITTLALTLHPTARISTRNRTTIVPAAAILHFAAEQGWCAYTKVARFRGERAEPKHVDPADLERVIQAAADNGDTDLHDLLLFLLVQGWRIGEAVSLGWRHVNFDTRELTAHNHKERTWQVVPLFDATAALLQRRRQAARADAEWVWPWQTPYTPKNRLYSIAKRIGVAVSPHDFRRNFASHWARAGLPSSMIARASTWTTSKTVDQFYVSLTINDVRATMDKGIAAPRSGSSTIIAVSGKRKTRKS